MDEQPAAECEIGHIRVQSFGNRDHQTGELTRGRVKNHLGVGIALCRGSRTSGATGLRCRGLPPCGTPPGQTQLAICAGVR